MSGREILDRPAPPADLRLPYGDGPCRFIDFRFPARAASPMPLVVHFHGGFWRNRRSLLHGGNVCAALTRAGIVTANVEYRRVGDEGGGFPGTLDDAAAALRFARDWAARSGSPPLTIVTGHSAGGHLALWLAGEDPELAGVVALAPVACLREAWRLRLGDGAVQDFLRGSPSEVPESYAAACPTERPASVPRVLIHGISDDIVPLSVSRTYVETRSADRGPVRLNELPGASHFDVIDPESPAWRSVADAVNVLLRVNISSD